MRFRAGKAKGLLEKNRKEEERKGKKGKRKKRKKERNVT